METVSEYKAIFEDSEKHGAVRLEIELQALNAQNMADMTRKIYGEQINLIAIYKLCDDWK
jgi:hypothetical protein